MKRLRTIVQMCIAAALLVGAAAGCSLKRLPDDKATLAGTWCNATTRVTIGDDLQVRYERRSPALDVQGRIKKIDGDDLLVEHDGQRTPIRVQEPPKQVGKRWLTKIDGALLVRDCDQYGKAVTR